MTAERGYLHEGDDVPIGDLLSSLAGRGIKGVTYLAGADALNLITTGWEIHETQEVELSLDSGSTLNITWALVGLVEGLLVGIERTYAAAVAVDVSATHLWRDVLNLPVEGVTVHTHLTGPAGTTRAVAGVTLRWGNGNTRTIALGELIPGDPERASYIHDALVVVAGDSPPDYQPVP